MSDKTTMQDLRDHLFETLEELRNKEKPMELDRAKMVTTVADALIKSAKVEVDYLKLVGPHSRTQFFPALPALPNGNGKAAAESLKDKKCADCAGEQKETDATHRLPGGTTLCKAHYNKRTGMAAHA